MKKLLLLITLGSLIFSGASFAQVSETPTRDGAVKRDGGFHVPRALRGNEDVQEALATYRASQVELRSSMSEVRKRLAAAGEEGKEAIKTELRELMIAHRKAQLEFRKNVRSIARELRRERAVSPTEG